MRLFLIVGILIFHWQCQTKAPSRATESADVKLYTIPIASSQMEVDQLGIIYLVSPKNEFIKLNNSFQLSYRYFNKSLGSITTIDVTNPLRILMYQSDFGRLTVLDNTLSSMKEINLYSYGFTDISTIARSNDDNIWMYDPTTYKLIKLNELGKVLIESSTLTDLGFEGLNVSMIKERDNFVFLSDPSLGILIFDNLGQFVKIFRRKGIRNFSASKHNITIWEEGEVLRFDTKFFEEAILALPADVPLEDLKSVKRLYGKWYFQYSEGIIIR